MARQSRSTNFVPRILGLLLSLILALVALAQDPHISYTKFSSDPTPLYFFENSTAVLYLDSSERAVYVSHDGGKSWAETDTPRAEAFRILLHPFDNHYAFILSKGKSHYRTSDRGQTWQEFFAPGMSGSLPQWNFHSDPKKSGYILYSGMDCDEPRENPMRTCRLNSYYTRDAFSSEVAPLINGLRGCKFAHSVKGSFQNSRQDLMFCTVYENAKSQLVTSNDFFKSDWRVVDFGARGHYFIDSTSFTGKFATVQLWNEAGGMQLYVSLDLDHWVRARFPEENCTSYLMVPSLASERSKQKLAFTITVPRDLSGVWHNSLLVSNSNGTFFIESLTGLSNDWQTNLYDIDYVDGVQVANVVMDSDDVSIPDSKCLSATRRSLTGVRGERAKLQSRITFDGGSTWSRLIPPIQDVSGMPIGCDPAPGDTCSLHVHNTPERPLLENARETNSSAPGLAIRIGSVGPYRRPYNECDTFLSTDAGLSWAMIGKGPHLYGFANHGSSIVLVRLEDEVDEVAYSNDSGKSWRVYGLEYKMRPLALTRVADPYSEKFLLSGYLPRSNQTGPESTEAVIVYLDFTPLRKLECTSEDFEKWYIHDSSGRGCFMGEKRWYYRRKADSSCFIGNSTNIYELENGGSEESCPCTTIDYECDYNHVKKDGLCVRVGPERIPANVCFDPSSTYLGSSGYRLIAGNACERERGISMDRPVEKNCAPHAKKGEIVHQPFEFSSEIIQHGYLEGRTTILVRLRDGTIWQSNSDGYTWIQLLPNERFSTFITHAYSRDRAYLLTKSREYYYTTDAGRSWNKQRAPALPNTFTIPVLQFSPIHDHLLWTGDADCGEDTEVESCHAEAYYSSDHGRSWRRVERYVRNCMWVLSHTGISRTIDALCESYEEKKGNQHAFNPLIHTLQLNKWESFSFADKSLLFDRVIESAKLSDYHIVKEYQEANRSLNLRVSRDGKEYVESVLPKHIHLQNHVLRMLDVSAFSIFFHLTTSEIPNSSWGVLLKSDTDGATFVISVENVNRDDQGTVDFEKLPDLDGIMIVNVVKNPEDAIIAGRKEIQTQITRDDGRSWDLLSPPKEDSRGSLYLCLSDECTLHLHGASGRPRDHPSLGSINAPGLVIATGNVGKVLAPYEESNVFISRDAGLTWKEARKGPHIWAISDGGSFIVMAGVKKPTDTVFFSTDGGYSWNEFRIAGQDKISVTSIITMPQGAGRKFVLFGNYFESTESGGVVYLDFSSLTSLECVNDPNDPSNSDYELWNPYENHEDGCQFGRQTFYRRKNNNRDCKGDGQRITERKVVKACVCTDNDFECESNFIRNSTGNCVLIPGRSPLPDDSPCAFDGDLWFERTAYRRIPSSSCEGGLRLDKGRAHLCSAIVDTEKRHGLLFWSVVVYLCLAVVGVLARWFYRRYWPARGSIRLPEDEPLEIPGSN
ncbi:hypothetical protein M0805_009901 [Coniferiporia weirii]|nr:hypothetical protein M0805_009901 [Coniferiporia weirii]